MMFSINRGQSLKLVEDTRYVKCIDVMSTLSKLTIQNVHLKAEARSALKQ